MQYILNFSCPRLKRIFSYCTYVPQKRYTYRFTYVHISKLAKERWFRDDGPFHTLGYPFTNQALTPELDYNAGIDATEFTFTNDAAIPNPPDPPTTGTVDVRTFIFIDRLV